MKKSRDTTINRKFITLTRPKFRVFLFVFFPPNTYVKWMPQYRSSDLVRPTTFGAVS